MLSKKDLAADKRMRRVYGVTLSWYNKQLKKQGGGCAICGRPPKKVRLAIDHNHKSLKTRGLLCMICNRKVLGVIERFKIPVDGILNYLKTYDPTNPLIGDA